MDPEASTERKVWYSRGYLPHYDELNLFQMITYRLGDSLPASKLAELKDTKLTPSQIRQNLEQYLDAGRGCCLLGDPRIAAVAEQCLLHYDGQRYRMLAWVVMPNHIHALAQFHTDWPVNKVVHTWKSYVAHEANKILGRSGSFFQRDYFDRYIRNEEHFENAVKYIEWNPVTAGLAKHPSDWRFSSNHWR
jgi:REP element-mobilizing transposase RayT